MKNVNTNDKCFHEGFWKGSADMDEGHASNVFNEAYDWRPVVLLSRCYLRLRG